MAHITTHKIQPLLAFNGTYLMVFLCRLNGEILCAGTFPGQVGFDP